MNLGGVPIFWSSKLQTEINLLNLEAEYIYISQRMRKLVSARNLVLDLKSKTNLDLNEMGIVSKAHEDTIGTQEPANSKGPLLSARAIKTGI